MVASPTDSTEPAATRAVFFDALGTLVELEPPWEHLRSAIGPGVSDERLVAAVRVEMDYYRRHAHEGSDPDSLADLRHRCARVLSDELGAEVTAAELVAAVRLAAYPDAEPALRALAARGIRRIVVSNWDSSLTEAIRRCGLEGLIDGAISSAGCGARKPDPAIFAPALELAGCGPEEAIHIGDTPAEDLAAAAAAGIRALLVDRGDGGPATEWEQAGQAVRVTSLTEIVDHL